MVSEPQITCHCPDCGETLRFTGLEFIYPVKCPKCRWEGTPDRRSLDYGEFKAPQPARRINTEWAPAPESDSEYYLALDGKEQGPFTMGQVRSLWQAGRITSRTLYFEPTMKGWKPLALIVSLIEDTAQSRRALPALVKPAKSRGIFIILGLLFGGTGAHNFYAGHLGVGFVQLLMTFIIAASAIIDPGSLIWLIFSVLLVLWVLWDVFSTEKDGDGDPLM
jgi:TM2 domain-containing membrane protein YozV